jgi:hypothetical protein
MSRIPIWTKLWAIGGTLVFIGAGVPFLMVLHIIPSTFLLGGICFVSSTIGVMLSYVAMATYIRSARSKDDDFRR